MAFTMSGKTYTNHPLMDEIVYNCKKILSGIVIKNDAIANGSEIEDSLSRAQLFIFKYEDPNNEIPFNLYPFTPEELMRFGYDADHAKIYAKDKSAIPEEDRDDLMRAINGYVDSDGNLVPGYFEDDFVEKNNYYRTFIGLPPYNTGELYYVYLDKVIDNIPDTVPFDPAKPLHEQDDELISYLYGSGRMAELRKTYPGSNYGYMDYLGNRMIGAEDEVTIYHSRWKNGLYKSRVAKKWDILYMPSVYYLIEDRFTELYLIEKDIYINRYYHDVNAFNGEYYDYEMIIMLLAQVFGDMISEVSEWYIRRDIFDLRSCKYFLESNGVKFFSEIPLRYQIRIVKNLNKLVKYKSSDRNYDDILEIFDNNRTQIMEYYLFKNRKRDERGNFIINGTNDEKYSLEFISAKLGDSYDAYIKDNMNHTLYNDITLQDPYWDGPNDHNTVKEQILDREFSIEPTKYISIDFKTSMTEYQYQLEYFLGLIMSSDSNFEDLEIAAIPSINEDARFTVTNLFLFLILLSNSFYKDSEDEECTSIVPPEYDYESSYEYEENGYYDNNYNWKKRIIPEIYGEKRTRVYGFNPDFDYNAMVEFIKTRRHSHYIFGASYEAMDFDNPGQDTPLTNEEYAERAQAALDELGINKFKSVKNFKPNNWQELLDMYQNNTEAYDALMDALKSVDNNNDKLTLEYIFQEMYTRKYDSDFYGGYTDLVDVLKNRGTDGLILYEKYVEIMQQSSIEGRQELIRDIVNDVISTLSYYIYGDHLDLIFSFTVTESLSAITWYIYLLINFFKSYKVHIIDPYMTLVVDNNTPGFDNVSGQDEIADYTITFDPKYEKAFIYDTASFKMYFNYHDNANIKEAVDINAYYDADPFWDNDFDGLNAANGENLGWQDVNGGYDVEGAPYFMVNGGTANNDPHLLENIDGGNAKEYTTTVTYINIDGGYHYNPDDERTDWYGSQGFNYEFDGANASDMYANRKGLEVKISNGYLEGNITLSKQYTNDLKIIPKDPEVVGIDPKAGLYFKDTYANKDEFDHLTKSLMETLTVFNSVCDKAKSIEPGVIDKYFYKMQYCLNSDLLNS